jgi:histidinol dehydrogenase
MIERLAVATVDAPEMAAYVRAFVPAAAAVSEVVAGIVASVREGGDRALAAHERRFGNDGPLLVAPDELIAALEALDPDVRRGLETARENVARVA